MADYDGDGRTDLISGCSCCQFASGFYVFRRQKDGGFGQRQRVDVKLRVPDLRWTLATGNGLRTKVAVADWNAYGHPDAVIGGNTAVLGVAYGPLAGKDKLTAEHVWPNGEEPFQRMTTNPCVADWDGDGLPDLVVGGYKDGHNRYQTQGVYWLRNVGTKDEPKLAEPRLLIGADIADELCLYATGVCVADFNGDSRLDLIASRKQRGGPPKYTTHQHQVWVYLRQDR